MGQPDRVGEAVAAAHQSYAAQHAAEAAQVRKKVASIA
jgi:hypothetical protein